MTVLDAVVMAATAYHLAACRRSRARATRMSP